MAKKAKWRKIISNKFYYPDELAELVELSVITIYRHIKNSLPADTGTIPYIIFGREAKNYFRELYSRDKVEIASDEVQCLSCKSIICLYDIPTEILTTGKLYCSGKYQVTVSGKCPNCGRRFCRFKSFLSGRRINRDTSIHIDMLTGTGKNEMFK